MFAIVLLSGALGAAISAEKKKKLAILTQFYEFNEKLSLNMKYGKDKISTVAQGYGYVQKALNGEYVLKDEDGEFIKDYAAGLGVSDAPTQLDYLKERGEQLKTRVEACRENYKKYGSLYFKLCVMAGILIAVLLA